MTDQSARALAVPWHVGRKLGTTLYATTGGDPDGDLLLGVIDSAAGRQVAAHIVDLHNAALDQQRWRDVDKGTCPICESTGVMLDRDGMCVDKTACAVTFAALTSPETGDSHEKTRS